MTRLTSDELQSHLNQHLSAWHYDENTKQIRRDIQFKDFYHTMAFVNAIAWIAHQTNHHPDLAVGYNYCHVRYSTHDAGGVTLKDMACARAVDKLLISPQSSS